MDNKPFVNNVERLPVVIERGQGNKLIDDAGNEYYDLWGDEGVASLGYGHMFNRAIAEFLGEGHPHRLPDMYHNSIRTKAAQVLCDNIGFDRVFFCNSGAEVNEAMIKIARRYWSEVRGEKGRKYIVTLKGNFHGRTGFALAASDSSESPYHKLGFGPFPEGFGVISEADVIAAAEAGDEPGIYHCAYENHAPFIANDETHGIEWRDIAAITMAPILGNNVVHQYSREFWSAMEVLRKRYGFLLLFDEVQVANGRTGFYAAWQHPSINVKPDIIGIGKGLALGLPAAAMLMTEEVAQAFTPGVHFSTFGGTIIVCWMILKLQQYLAENRGRILDLGTFLHEEFTSRLQDGINTEAEAAKRWIAEVDGTGVHWGFTPDWDLLGTDGFKFCEKARDFGLLLVTHRPKGCIRFTPPLTITQAELADIMERLDKTAQALAGIKP